MLRKTLVSVLCLLLLATLAGEKPAVSAVEITFQKTGDSIYVPNLIYSNPDDSSSEPADETDSTPAYIISEPDETDNTPADIISEPDEIDNTPAVQTVPVSSEDNIYVKRYNANYPAYAQQELPIIEKFRSTYNDSLVHAIVGRAIWYMENGYMIYGHEKYPKSGLIDCSNFVSLVYKDFGYNITSAARKYDTVGSAVKGVYSRNIKGSKTKYELVGIDKLRPGDVMTFWKEDSSGKRYIAHVALYIGKIDGKPTIIQTCKDNPTAIGITTSFKYWYGEHFAGARRVLSTPTGNKTSFTDAGPVIPAVYKLPPQKAVVLPQNLPNGF